MTKNYSINKNTNLSIITIMLFVILASLSSKLYAQNETEAFPKIKGSVGIVHPIVTFSSEDTTVNFRDYYVVGMPIAINVWKNKSIGFSFEVVPMIKTDDGISKVSSVIIHPGILVRLKHEFTFAGRAAFETSGRFGFTPVISKAIGIHKDYNYYISIPVPVRFGNDKPASVTPGFQFGISF